MALHKYWKTMMMMATSYIGDSPLFLLDYLLRFLRVVVLLAIWRLILVRDASISMSLEEVLTYTLIAEVFSAQLAVRTRLDLMFWEGSIIGKMLQPLGLFRQFTAEMCGKWLFEGALFSLPLLLCSPLLGVDPRPANLTAFGLFVISLLLAISVGLALDFIFNALLVIYALPLWAISQIRSAVITLLSGAMIPLALLPESVGNALAWLPFASMASAPLQLYVGTGEPISLIGLQIGWSIVLWPLAHWLWYISRERMLSYGG